MKKRLTLWMILLFVPLVLFISLHTADSAFRQSLESEMQRAQVAQGLIAADMRRSTQGQTYPQLLSFALKVQDHYRPQGIQLHLIRGGTSLTEFTFPQDSYRGLLTGGRAALLDTLSRPQRYVIGDSLSGGLRLLFISDVSGVYALRDALRREALLYAGLGALAVAVLSLLLAHGFTRPLHRLTMAARRMAAGEKEAAALPLNRRDELGTLAQSFGQMQQAVQAREQALQREVHQRQRLLDALAHEMRTPLTSLLGNARLLEGDRLSPDQRQEVAGDMAREIKRLSGLDEQLLKLTALPHEGLTWQEVALAPLLRQAAGRFQPLYPDNPIVVAGGEGQLWGDEELLSLLVDNLLSNALKASKKGQSVTLKPLNGGFSVTDTGKGMTEEQLRHAADPFYKGDSSRASRGIGLGLSICQRIAALHGGELSLVSQVGQGTTATYLMGSAAVPPAAPADFL